jgi:hypothetical protein
MYTTETAETTAQGISKVKAKSKHGMKQENRYERNEE